MGATHCDCALAVLFPLHRATENRPKKDLILDLGGPEWGGSDQIGCLDHCGPKNSLRIFFGSVSVTDYKINSPEIFLGKVGNSVNISW